MILIIAIQGSIGSGKSTVLENDHVLFSRLRDEFVEEINVCVLREPVELWEYDSMLPGYYNGTVTPFVFQTYIMSTQMHQMLDALIQPYDVIVFERDIHSSKQIFGEMLKSRMTTEEQTAYNCLYDMCCGALSYYDIVSYNNIVINTNPTECISRLSTRQRKYEMRAITMEYMQQLDAMHHKYYDNVIPYGKNIIINGNRNKQDVLDDVVDAIVNVCSDYFLRV